MEANKNQSTPPSKRRSIWPYLIVGLLAAHVTGMVVAVTITEHDKTFLVVPDYYDKAQHWDASQAEKRASASLRWKVQIEPATTIDERGNRAVRFVLTDAKGNGLPGATLQVDYFHHAHPDQQRKALLSADANDARAFTSLLPMPFSGVWEFHFTAQSGEKTFAQTQTLYVISQRQSNVAAK